MALSPVARLGDPISHGGSITSASANVRANGIGVARLADTATCLIHGPTTISTASAIRKANGRGIARVGDACACGALISAGSPSVNSV